MKIRPTIARIRQRGLARATPVLLYHAFGRADENDRFVVTEKAFARQIWILRLLRFRVIHFEALARALREGRRPPRRSVVITVDDGYVDNLEIAQPVLRKHRFPWTIFVVSRRAGRENDWTEGGALGGRPLLSLNQLAQLPGDQVRTGAHTRTHCHLPGVPDNAGEDEIAGSREDLESSLGVAVETFAYPYGEFDERAVGAVRRAGFAAACTVEPRLARSGDDPHLIPRIEIRSSDSLLTFLAKVCLGGA